MCLSAQIISKRKVDSISICSYDENPIPYNEISKMSRTEHRGDYSILYYCVEYRMSKPPRVYPNSQLENRTLGWQKVIT